MIIFGWALLTIGALGTAGAVILEIRVGHPVYMLIMKITACCFGVGGIILGISAI